ncbi:MAG: tRNA (adenosine(37)-N6)-dimethylallyltransferase MiaA [Candidatus Limnocylindrales bacterium]
MVICGATATGKTALSLAVAEALGNAQILSADSRQVYRGMDIGTAKATADERARVQHHGLDLVDPDEAFTVADFVRHAGGVFETIASAGAVAVMVGGTGLYLRAVARGMPITETGTEPVLRERLEQRLVGEGLHTLVAQLRAMAPGVAARTDVANPRRVVRALERVAIAGDVPPPEPTGYPGAVLWLGLAAEPAEHRAAILARARHQFASGLLDEARILRERFGSDHRSFSAVGYHEAWDVLDGRADLEAAISEDAQRSRAYARRQRTWFRAEPDVTWLAAGDPATTSTAIAACRDMLAA